ncbi:hypothetical protein D9M68_807990 [compost metagenome]
MVLHPHRLENRIDVGVGPGTAAVGAQIKGAERPLAPLQACQARLDIGDQRATCSLAFDLPGDEGGAVEYLLPGRRVRHHHRLDAMTAQQPGLVVRLPTARGQDDVRVQGDDFFRRGVIRREALRQLGHRGNARVLALARDGQQLRRRGQAQRQHVGAEIGRHHGRQIACPGQRGEHRQQQWQSASAAHQKSMPACAFTPAL